MKKVLHSNCGATFAKIGGRNVRFIKDVSEGARSDHKQFKVLINEATKIIRYFCSYRY